MTTNAWDVIVVGGGLAGLAAGATAAAGGASTLVLDAHLPGGRARTTERDGFVFNMGAHALYQSGGGMGVLRSLGIRPVGSPPPLSRYRVRIGAENHLLPSGPTTLARTRALSGRGKAQFAALLATLGRTDARRLEGMSVNTWLAERDLTPSADTIIRALVRISTYAAEFDTFAADAAVRQLQTALKGGVLYLDGGWSQLIDGLSALVEVRARTAVRTLEPGAGGVEVVTDDGRFGRFVAKSVVVALGTPKATRALLPADPGWGEIGDPVTAACLDVGVRGVPSPGYVLGADDPVYATTQSPPARQAPVGCAVVSVVRYGATGAPGDRVLLKRYLHEAGVVPDDIVTSRFLAHLTVAGAAPTASAGGLPGRPTIRATGSEGVFIAGDWVGPSGLIGDAALTSGHHAGLAALQSAGKTRMVA
jgi:phytoene dehydrogenase-like protein